MQVQGTSLYSTVLVHHNRHKHDFLPLDIGVAPIRSRRLIANTLSSGAGFVVLLGGLSNRQSNRLIAAMTVTLSICTTVSCLCVCYLVWRLVPLDVQLVLLCLCCSAVVAAASVAASIRRNGLLAYSPQWLTDILVNQSLLHFLSDATLLKEARKYAPLFLGLSPEELRLYLAGAPADVREKLTRPGTLHLFPISWQEWLHPPSARKASASPQQHGLPAPASAEAPAAAEQPAATGIAALLASVFSPLTKHVSSAHASDDAALAPEAVLNPNPLPSSDEPPPLPASASTPGAAFDQVMSRILAMRAMSGVTDALGTVDQIRPRLLAAAAGGTALLLLRFAMHRRSRSAFLRSTVAVATGGTAVSVTLLWALLALHSWARRRAARAQAKLQADTQAAAETSPEAGTTRTAQTQPAAATRQEQPTAAAPSSAFASSRPGEAGGVRRRLRFE